MVSRGQHLWLFLEYIYSHGLCMCLSVCSLLALTSIPNINFIFIESMLKRRKINIGPNSEKLNRINFQKKSQLKLAKGNRLNIEMFLFGQDIKSILMNHFSNDT